MNLTKEVCSWNIVDNKEKITKWFYDNGLYFTLSNFYYYIGQYKDIFK